MLTVTARDIQYRYRRFLIGVLITALVFGIAFIFDGVKRAVRNEATRIVDVFGADAWVVPAGSPGRQSRCQAGRTRNREPQHSAAPSRR